MDVRRSVAGVALACLMATAAAQATVGGASRVEIVGYAPEDGKVYYLQGTNLELDALHFVHVTEPEVGEAVFVKSYYGPDGVDSTDFKKFNRRFSKLKKRLRPIELEQESSGQVNENEPRRELDGFEVERKVLKRWKDADYDVPCREVELAITETATGLKATVTTKECFYWRGRFRVTRVYALPDSTAKLVVLSGVPDPFEGGYVTERVVVLHPLPPVARKPAAPPTEAPAEHANRAPSKPPSPGATP